MAEDHGRWRFTGLGFPVTISADMPQADIHDPMQDPRVRSADSSLDVEVLIVGAGISGIGAGIKLLRRGHSSVILLEAEQELGGTWRDNTYPGVAVDIPFSSYCYSFETDYPWSRFFPAGSEIHGYVRHCAEKYGITNHIQYNSKVLRTQFEPGSNTWLTRLSTGAVLKSRYVISATGLLSQPKSAAIPGLDTFAGKTMHSARWDHGHDLVQKRVGVIGTGASAVQIVPEIAGTVSRLTVFQRTPIWVSPRPDCLLNRHLKYWLHHVAVLRYVFRALSESGIQALTFAIVNYRRLPFIVKGIQAGVRVFMRRQLRDPALEAMLIPDYELGCKRPATSNSYLQAFGRENVTLITDAIDRICEKGVITTDGRLHEIDTLILATGFLTTEKGNAPSFEVVGCEGAELGQFWQDNRLQAYAGVAVPGFPNFFLTAGPYSGGFNWFTMLEAHLKHIMRCLDRARAEGVTRIEVKREAHEHYMHRMWKRADGTVFKSGSCESANSYYLDRRGDAALPLPKTPWSRSGWIFFSATRGYVFGEPSAPDRTGP
jgi:cation diffusion facilitator CzcD-associated flavoprotein CzcO